MFLKTASLLLITKNEQCRIRLLEYCQKLRNMIPYKYTRVNRIPVKNLSTSWRGILCICSESDIIGIWLQPEAAK